MKVHYIRADGSEIRSETKILRDVPAASRLALTAPDFTAAGKELKVSLEAVHCSAIGLCYYSSTSDKSEDPYQCR